jgi:hypothetical protein
MRKRPLLGPIAELEEAISQRFRQLLLANGRPTENRMVAIVAADRGLRILWLRHSMLVAATDDDMADIAGSA